MTVAREVSRFPRIRLGAVRWPARLSGGQVLVHICLLVIVVLWTMPTAGLFVSSLRDKQQLSVSGWWTSLVNSETSQVSRLPSADAQIEENGLYVIRGSVFPDKTNETIGRYGLTATTAGAAPAGSPLPMQDGGTIVLARDGTYQWSSPTQFMYTRSPRVFFVAEIPPRFTLDNYIEVLSSEGVGRAFGREHLDVVVEGEPRRDFGDKEHPRATGVHKLRGRRPLIGAVAGKDNDSAVLHGEGTTGRRGSGGRRGEAVTSDGLVGLAGKTEPRIT